VTVTHCRDVSKNMFDLDNTIGQTFGHACNTNGRMKSKWHNTMHVSINFNTI